MEGVFTHFAKADYKDKKDAKRQLGIFLDFIRIHMPESHLDMVRPGIAIYGL